MDAMASVFVEVERQMRTLCWISRVSSYSNIADGPSRGDNSLVSKLGFVDVSKQAYRQLYPKLAHVSYRATAKLGKKADKSNPKE